MIQKVSNKIQLNHTNENISTFGSRPSLIKEIARPFGAWSRDVIVTKLFNDNFCFIPFFNRPIQKKYIYIYLQSLNYQ